jgi:hypothetical protein
MRKLSFLLLIFFLGACTASPRKEQFRAVQYFDLKDYIARESKRLAQLQPEIDKYVEVNTSAEHKKLKIADWQKELSVFADADINKSAWQGLFTLNATGDRKVYQSDNDKVPVKSLSIQYKNGKIFGLQILISTVNSLYTSNDTLSYFPDSLYEVKKTQHIKLLNKKKYHITGKFN